MKNDGTSIEHEDIEFVLLKIDKKVHILVENDYL